MLRFADPFAELDRLMGQAGGRWRGGLMPMDAYEQGGTYTLRFDLPGVDPDGIDITVENNTLTVTAERPIEDLEGVNWLMRERPTGTHSRQVYLADKLDTGDVDASYDGGVLTVTIPMRPEAKPRKVKIGTGHTQDAISAGAEA